LICVAGGRAFAACEPPNPGSGGTVTCSATDNDGYTAPANTAVTINVESGASVTGTGINVSGTGDSFVNNLGTIGGTSSVVFNGVAGFSKTLNNDGTLNAGIVGSGDGIIVINQNGALNSGGITITGNGQNTLNIFAGKSVNGLASIEGARNFVDDQGTFNAGLTMTATELNSVIIRAGGSVSGTFSLTGPRNFVDNFGTFNSAITLNGGGQNLVVNRGTGVMQGITSNGQARDFVYNNGQVNQTVALGNGNDVLVNSGTISNAVDMGNGDDVFDMLAGTINGNVTLGSGDDQGFIRDGSITNTVLGGDGDDHVVWTGGEIIGLDMGADTDFAHFIGLTPTNLKTGLRSMAGRGRTTCCCGPGLSAAMSPAIPTGNCSNCRTAPN
jgi:hypothetical protein